MSFGYYLRTLPANGGFSTRAKQGAEVTQDTLDAAVAALTGQPAAVCRAIGIAYIEKILDGIKTNNRYPDLFGYLRALPTSGGSSPIAGGFHNAEDIKVLAAFSLLREGINRIRDTTIEQLGQDEPEVPVFETVINEGNNHQNTWSTAQIVRIRGEHLKFDKNDSAQGVFVNPAAGGTFVRATTYGNITNGEVQFIVPSGFAGVIQITVRKKVGANLRFATYTINVAQE